MNFKSSFNVGMLSALTSIMLFSLVFVGCKKEEVSIQLNPIQELQKFEKELISVNQSMSYLSNKKNMSFSLIRNLLSEDKARQILKPLVFQSRKLIESFNLIYEIESNKDFSEKGMLAFAMIIYDREKYRISSVNVDFNENQFKTFALDDQEIGNCLANAFGLSGGFGGIYVLAKRMTIKGVVTLALSVLGRSISWVGWGFTAYYLTNCLVKANTD